MHTTLKRGSFAFSAMFHPTLCLLSAIFICSYLFTNPIPKSNLVVDRIDAVSYRRCAHFTPNIDLTPEFNYNVKQIFLYLRVVYPNGSSEILWSHIVKRGDNYVFNKNVKTDYEIRGSVTNNATLELRGCVFPFVGLIKDHLYGTVKSML